MAVDIFKELIVPVVGGLGIFMLGLEFMSNGINNLAANRMREWLASLAGTPLKGLFAGTLITGILQSSTAMTVMVVGLVNAGVVGLRPAISVIMGANIGTTLGNGLIALPLGPLGLLIAGIFALVHVFGKTDKIKNIALAIMGFALIFYGLNLLTGGLKPLRNLPEVMSVISALNADSFGGLLACVLTAAGITAMIHSSSATIGIVMGLGAAGVLNFETAVAFSLGADLGTTITSWMASLNLSRNAKRAAYAHISFNIIGVLIMLPLFFISMDLLKFVMQFFGGDPTKAVMVDGKETYPLVPVAVGIYSIGFNIFNTMLLFPFINVFDRVLSKIGHSAADDEEDYSIPQYLKPELAGNLESGVMAIQNEMQRYTRGSMRFFDTAYPSTESLADPAELATRLDGLNREIRHYTASMMKNPDITPSQANMLASLIEEEDFSASLTEQLYQIARRTERYEFTDQAKTIVEDSLKWVENIMKTTLETNPTMPLDIKACEQQILTWRDAVLDAKHNISWEQRGGILALLGTIERICVYVERIRAERQSVSRKVSTHTNTSDKAVMTHGQVAPVL